MYHLSQDKCYRDSVREKEQPRDSSKETKVRQCGKPANLAFGTWGQEDQTSMASLCYTVSLKSILGYTTPRQPNPFCSPT